MDDGNEDEKHLGVENLAGEVLVRNTVDITCANSDELISLFLNTRG